MKRSAPTIWNVFYNSTMWYRSCFCLAWIFLTMKNSVYCHLRRLLSHNKVITVTDEDGNIYSDGSSINQLYALNRLYCKSEGMLVEPLSERSSLVATALMECASKRFRHTAVLLSHFLYDLAQLARIDDLSDNADSPSRDWTHFHHSFSISISFFNRIFLQPIQTCLVSLSLDSCSLSNDKIDRICHSHSSKLHPAAYIGWVVDANTMCNIAIPPLAFTRTWLPPGLSQVSWAMRSFKISDRSDLYIHSSTSRPATSTTNLD